ncbi:tripartite tricarboxylate transporter substrate binding protein [Cupriavidus necator]|uniref:Bug family tripartite tricarboxylate transporter substrate binding protein n=1 Tax=Cupriavidus necator TaxID=106590 RepID=UPI0039C45D72
MRNLGSLIACLAFSGVACAQAYPSKPVTIIVPHAPGGANDAVARPIAQKLAAALGQSFVVDNRPGAGGNIGTGIAAKAPHDGYTLLLTVGSSHTINPSLYKTVPFDPIKDFEPIALVATAPYVLVVNPSLPVKSVRDLIQIAKEKQGQLTFASAGNGSLDHLLGEMFKRAAGVEMLHIPYKGAAAANTDLVAGRVSVAFGSLPGVMPFVKAGKLRLLAVATEKRSPLVPEAPTIAETLRGFGAESWYGLFAPAGTPKEVIARLRTQTAQVLQDRELKETLANQGAEVASASPLPFPDLIRSDLKKWAVIVKDSGARID